MLKEKKDMPASPTYTQLPSRHNKYSLNLNVFFFILLLLKLLLKPKFSGIEKIKTIGSTYMTASGLRPGKEEGAYVSCDIVINQIKSIVFNILLNIFINNVINFS